MSDPAQLAVAVGIVFALNLLPALLLGGFRPGRRPGGKLWVSPDERGAHDA